MPSSPHKRTPEGLLRAVFGYETFRPLQREVIDTVLAGRDALAIMPTGGGKSLCYQIPALIFEGLTVVVSPLISLMQDQVAGLNALGIPAAVLNSSLDSDTYLGNMNRVRREQTRLLYVAPETLMTGRLESLLSSVRVDLLTIDEAHCISEWGHDFRPEYRALVQVRARHPDAACLALTATATPRVQQDILSALHLKGPKPFIASFDRPNLFLDVIPKSGAQEQTIQFARSFPDQSGIIYCTSRAGVDTLADVLQRKGFSARPYHAGMEDDDRRRNQDDFVHDDVQIIVATIAFGMGINKPDVRFILHYDLPKNIEGYYQQIGRAGRDGLPAHCRLLYSYGDVRKVEYFIKDKEEPERTAAHQHLEAMVAYAEGRVCRRTPLLRYFGENPSGKNCGQCDICTGRSDGAQVDLGEEARLFFEVVSATGERFGAAHLVAVLLGRTNEKIERMRHDELSCYGAGKAHDERAWMDLSRQLERMGLLERTEYKGLRLTSQGAGAWRGKKPIMGSPLAVDKASPAPRIREKARPEQAPSPSVRPIPVLEYDIILFDLLRKKRKELADRSRLPAYTILPDRALVEMATYFPMSRKSMAGIYGFGEVKLERYAADFIQLIQEYNRSKANRRG